MFERIDTFEKQKEFLIAIDSDGCVFDNMTIKHRDYFFPQIMEVFQLRDSMNITMTEKELLDQWLTINLDYPSRGVNRFIGIGEFFEKIGSDYDLKIYKQWLMSGEKLTNDTLKDIINLTQDIFSEMVWIWSQKVNESLSKDQIDFPTFGNVVEVIKECARKADVIVVSSGNKAAIEDEWEKAGLLSSLGFIASQEDGSKKECLRKCLTMGYDSNHIMMIGDAYGDYEAAKSIGAHYYQITYKNETVSWDEFQSVHCESFLTGKYHYEGNEVLKIALKDALEVIKVNVDHYTDRFQHVSLDGVYPPETNRLWTASFYPGQLYLAYNNTHDPIYLKHRSTIIKSFEERSNAGHMETHDIGFLFELTAYYDYLHTGSDQSKDLVIRAAEALMKRYRIPGGYIQAWGPMEDSEPNTRIIIDTMLNLPLLYIATELTGNPIFKEAAISHAVVASQTLLRKDGSTFHTYYMDKKTGLPLYGATHQGHRNESTWARGQAWSLYGFCKSFIASKDPRFLKAAIISADIFIENIPQNDICYWDFDFTDENPDIRDSSAASIAACGFLQLSKIVDEPLKNNYEYWGKRLLYILANRYQNKEIKAGYGILKEGMYHRNDGARAYTSWGDYYYVEALSTILKDEEIPENM